MQVWIDKQGGRHFHKKDCPMAQEPPYHYEPIKRRITYHKHFNIPRDIIHEHKRYMPCPRCFWGK